MSYQLYLSYSGLSCYKACPKRYYLCYVLKKEISRNPRDVMFGSVIGRLFEWFYEGAAWRRPDPGDYLLSRAEDAMAEVFAKEKFDPATDPSYVATLRNDLKTYVPAGVEVIRRHRLLTPGSKAEVDLTVEYTRGGVTLKLGGKADFIHPTDVEESLLDGKSSRHRGTYVDPYQIIWYASLHYLKFHRAPTKIGFLHWRFPADPLQWVDYGEADVRKCVDDAFDVAEKVRLKMFAPTVGQQCRRCDFRKYCDEGREYVVERDPERPDAVQTSVFDVERVL